MSRSVLSSPLKLPCGAVLPNRLAKSAMSERLARTDRAPSAQHATLYRRWSEGGLGLSITGNVMVDPDHLGERGNVALEDDRHATAFRAWAEACAGTPTWVQLNHPGRQAPRKLDPAPVAPSAVVLPGTLGLFAEPRALTDVEVGQLVVRFARSAGLVRAAGFAGVQLHAAHGYLINQFLSPRTNLRDDRWGGDLAGRSAFLLEVVRAVRAEVGPTFPVGVKLNTADFQRGGFSEDDAVEVAVALQAAGVDLLELSGGTYERARMFDEPTRASTRSREAFFLEQAAKVRARTTLPLMVTGGFRSRAAMEEAMRSGALDVVGLARPLAVEPDLARRLLDGSADAAVEVRLATGVAQLDGVVNAGWYQAQLERLARGLPADPNLWRLGAVSWYVRDLLSSSLDHRR